MSARMVPEEAAAAAAEPPARRRTALTELLTLFRALVAAPHFRLLAVLAGSIVVVVCLNAVMQIRLNDWFQPFYDALQRREVRPFVQQLSWFAVIAGALLVLVVLQTWLAEITKVRLREWLSHELAEQWLRPNRVYRLAFIGEIGVNPDQRMQEDARHLCELSADLGVGLLQATLLLLSFVGVLWVLSDEVMFTWGEHSFHIPGYMVWCALIYSGIGSWVAWKVGSPLVPLNAERYAREAELRSALVRLNEHGEGIALFNGEADEQQRLDQSIERVVDITRRLAYGLARLTWITSGYGWLAIVVPILVAAPGFFAGALTLGGLMVVVGAFNQVQQALRWFVDNLSRIADWRATLDRIATFRDALAELETLGADCGTIEIVHGPEQRVVLERLAVVLSDGEVGLEEERVEIGPGERVQIIGAPGVGKSTLFRAIGGLWPWGSGLIRLPEERRIMFLPHRPYLPPGRLKDAVAYPAAGKDVSDAQLAAALARVGLERLAAAPERSERWDKELSIDEQQRLVFARLLLHAPAWIFMDEALEAIDESHRAQMIEILETDLAAAAVIGIGRRQSDPGFYRRTVQMVRRPGMRRLRLDGPLLNGSDAPLLCEIVPVPAEPAMAADFVPAPPDTKKRHR